MERNMELVLRILRGVNTSKGDLGAGFTYVVAPEHERIIKQPNVVLLPADVCPDAETLYYHFAIMEQADLIETTRGRVRRLPRLSADMERKRFPPQHRARRRYRAYRSQAR